MNKLRWLVLGAISLLAMEALGALLVLSRAHGWSALEAPTGAERWVARRARDAAMPADAKNLSNPVPNTPEVFDEARAHWADHCAGCHANDGSGDSFMGKRMYPPAPDMRAAATQNLSDGELFYIIQNGIRLTGMPAWGSPAGSSDGPAGSSGDATGHSTDTLPNHDELDSWKLVHFIRHLPAVTLEERRRMEKMNPKSPDELREEEEEEKFLKGESAHEPETHQHH